MSSLQHLLKFSKLFPFCQNNLLDDGRVADDLDPYGHYADIERTNLDHRLQTKETSYCPHLLFCLHCQYDEFFN